MTAIEQQTPTGNRSFDLCRRTVTTESFIAEAKEIYGDSYDYSKVEYKNKDHRVTIICPVHGEFQVYAREHLDAVCRRFGVCEGKHHNALDDAEMCGNLILAFQAAIENGKVVPLEFEPLQETEQQEEHEEHNEDSGLFSFFKKLFN